MTLVSISAELSARVEALRFPSAPFVYNPLAYAWAPHGPTSNAGDRRCRAKSSCSA